MRAAPGHGEDQGEAGGRQSRGVLAGRWKEVERSNTQVPARWARRVVKGSRGQADEVVESERGKYLSWIGAEGPIGRRVEVREHTPIRREEVGGRGDGPRTGASLNNNTPQ